MTKRRSSKGGHDRKFVIAFNMKKIFSRYFFLVLKIEGKQVAVIVTAPDAVYVDIHENIPS